MTTTIIYSPIKRKVFKAKKFQHDFCDPVKAREMMNKLCGTLEVSEMGLKRLQNIYNRNL